MQPEGFRLTVTDQGILFQANDELGFYYAGQTLRQLVENGRDIPGCIAPNPMGCSSRQECMRSGGKDNGRCGDR